MKQYYVMYYSNYVNTYNLRWADNAADIATLTAGGYERITRADALRLARDEAARRRYDPASAYYADAHIYPARDDGAEDDYAPAGNSRVMEYIPRRLRVQARRVNA